MPRVSGKEDKDHLLALFGAAVRTRRKAFNLSQEALADHAGIDRSHMGKIERGERNVTLLNIARIADALRCKPSELLRDADH
ncbi:MAG: transcriptional regulator, family [Massilia sp.]|jgi:transcriptional regulator with XRE-family HTH domain|nr:transcriptional regulator, family [Massilia sp.]